MFSDGQISAYLNPGVGRNFTSVWILFFFFFILTWRRLLPIQEGGVGWAESAPDTSRPLWSVSTGQLDAYKVSKLEALGA